MYPVPVVFTELSSGTSDVLLVLLTIEKLKLKNFIQTRNIDEPKKGLVTKMYLYLKKLRIYTKINYPYYQLK